MKNLLALLALVIPVVGLADGQKETVTISTLHLRRASDVAMTYRVVCAQQVYTLVASMSPVDRRATSIALQVGEAATLRRVDITATELGQLMTDRMGFGELGFGCGADSLYARYLGARQISDGVPLVLQDESFRISPEGVVVRKTQPGVTVAPKR